MIKNIWKYSSMHLRKVYWMVPATLSKTLMKDSSNDFIRNIVDIKFLWERCIGSFQWLYWSSLKRFFYAFEKSLLKVYSEFINNIDDDYKRNLWKDSSMILLENLINTHIRNLWEKCIVSFQRLY